MNDLGKTKAQLLYVEVFEEIPLPATLADPRGTILDVNRAFLDHARSLGRNIRKEERIGRSIYDFADTEERAHLAALIQPLVSGERSYLSKGYMYVGRRQHYENVHASAIRDAAGQVAGILLLREDVTERVRQEERRQVLLQLREVIWSMAGSREMEQLLIAVRDSLERLGVPFHNCGVNLVDTRTDPPSVRFHNMAPTGYWTFAEPGDTAAGVVLRFWREQQVVYRKDLNLEDLYGERSNIERDHGTATRSVVDVPFAQGTLAVNSTEPDGFSEEDLEILQEMAQVLSEGFRRLDDLQSLEERNQELQSEIARRLQTEESLRQTEKQKDLLHQVREEVWKLGQKDDLEGVLRTISSGMEGMGVPFLNCEINQVEVSGDLPVVRCLRVLETAGPRKEYTMTDEGKEVVLRFWREAKLVYRPDLERTDVYGEGGRIRQWSKRPVRSVVDVPFSHGTLAVNSAQPNAFSEQHLEFLQELAGVLSEGFRRLDDLWALEAARRQTEENLKTGLALQQVRNKILQMQGEKDWQHIVDVVREQLQQLVPFNACSINLVDWEEEKSTVHYLRTDGTRLIVLPGLPPALRQARETGRYVYRRNQAEMRQCEDRVELFEQGAHSVVDVPFTGGTLAINSREEEAFSARGIEILEQFAQVLSEAHRRLQDLQALEEKETLLRQAQKLEAIGQLAGGVAHDFNNLLAIVSGYTEYLLWHVGPDQPHHASLQEIQKAAERGTSLVRQLLAFSRKQVLQPSALNLNAVVADLGKMLQRLIGEDVELKLVLEPGLGIVQADRGQFEQVLLNLAVNARDAMPQGGKLVIETAESN